MSRLPFHSRTDPSIASAHSTTSLPRVVDDILDRADPILGRRNPRRICRWKLILNNLVRCGLYNAKPSAPSFSVTIDLFFAQARYASDVVTPRQGTFSNVVRKSDDHFVPATSSSPLQRLTAFVVTTNVWRFLDRCPRARSKHYRSQHKPSPMDTMLQFAVRTLIDQLATFPLFVFGPLESSRQAFTDMNATCLHLGSSCTSKIVAVTPRRPPPSPAASIPGCCRLRRGPIGPLPPTRLGQPPYSNPWVILRKVIRQKAISSSTPNPKPPTNIYIYGRRPHDLDQVLAVITRYFDTDDPPLGIPLLFRQHRRG